MAHIVKWPIVNRLMRIGIVLLVPRQRIGVSVVAIDENERVLLLKHVFHPYMPWGIPGGWLDRNEAPDVGALRELKEETGLTAVIGPLLHLSHDSPPDHISIAYLVQVTGGSLTLSPEIIDAQWFAADELPSPLGSFVREAITIAYQQKQSIGSIVDPLIP